MRLKQLISTARLPLQLHFCRARKILMDHHRQRRGPPQQAQSMGGLLGHSQLAGARLSGLQQFGAKP
eukprot:1149447-Pelagomonas_calceolata.AAC.8